MHMPADFLQRLMSVWDTIRSIETPFHIYDETGIRRTGESLKRAFAWEPGFQEFFAVKALPNPAIMKIMLEMGFGFDCSSMPEVEMARRLGASADRIMFTSNNTSDKEFSFVLNHDDGVILNLDDESMIERAFSIARQRPELVCFRYNPGNRRQGINNIIGNPEEQKYGVPHERIKVVYERSRTLGASRFGLHTMIASNTREADYIIETAKMLLDVAGMLKTELGIELEFINIGGGIGIPYGPEDKVFDLAAMSAGIRGQFGIFKREFGYQPRLYMESGRYMTGPHGVLVARVINRMLKYKKCIGLDACMSSLMRSAIYGAYHGIICPDHLGGGSWLETVDVVGSLCENNDKFAINRELPALAVGDLVLIENTGAHGHAMGFNYNGRLRPAEYLFGLDGSLKLIRRAETMEDYFRTLVGF